MEPAIISVWTTLIDDQRGTLLLEMHPTHGPFLHLDLRQWGMDVAHSLHDGFTTMKRTLKACGHPYVNVIINEGDEKLYRFETFFGFKEIARKDGLIYMRQET